MKMFLKLFTIVVTLCVVNCGRRRKPAPVKTCLDYGNCKGNVAEKKMATQWPVSSFPASNAVDGNIDSNLSGGSCVEIPTVPGGGSRWWQVDLGGTFPIEKVVVYNRLDKYSEKMSGFVVHIVDEDLKHSEVCGKAGDMANKQFAQIKCNGWKIGKFVKIELPKTGALNFCEVQVFQPKKGAVCGRRGMKQKHVVGSLRAIRNHVINGNRAARGDWPWMASLQFTGGRHFCGATVIDTKWAVTAAQCLTMYEEQKKYGKFTLVAGMSKLSNAQAISQTFEFEKVIIHPDFNTANADMRSDIALIKLNKYVRMTPELNLACVPDEQAALPSPGESCYFLGWGSSKFPKPSTDDLQQGKVPIVPASKCTPDSETKTRDVICTGSETGGPSACQFDAGGPLICEENGRWTVQGLVSFTKRHCDSYTGFTPVNKYRRWIDDTIKRN